MQKTSPKILIPVLMAAAVMIMFSGTCHNVGIFAWLWPGFMLYFTRHSRKRWLPIAGLFYAIAFNVFNYDILGTGNYALSIACNTLIVFICFLPFVIDRFLFRRLPDSLSVLLFPLGIAAEEFLFSLTHISFLTNLAYTQAGNSAFIQSAALIGTYGVSALIAACGSVAVFCIDADFQWNRMKKPLCIYLVLLLLAEVYGGFRQATESEPADTLKVALANGPAVSVSANGEWEHISYAENITSLKEAFAQASASRAELIAFNEESFSITDVEEASFTAEISSLVRSTGMAAMVPLEVSDTNGDEGGLSWNKLVFVDAAGNVIADYEKSMLVPVIETADYIAGDGVLPCVTITINGKAIRFSMDICYDGDFPSYIRTQADDVDIWLEPCWEWESIRRFHTSSHIFRAIENGTNLVKPTYLGDSVVADYRGNILAKSSDIAEDVLIADVPVEGVQTVYETIGCILDWAYVAAFLAIVLLAIARNRS